MQRVERCIVFRGTEAYHFVRYLTEKGITLGENQFMLGEVRVAVETLSPHHLGRIAITQVSLTLTGRETLVQQLEEKLRKHFMTAGG